METHQRIEHSYLAAEQATAWLRGQISENGSYSVPGLMPHYKTPLLMGMQGFENEGSSVLSWIIANYTESSWHSRDPADVAASKRHCDLYEDLWLAWGAATTGRVREAKAIYDFCLCHQDSESGGVRSRIGFETIATSHCDLRSTALMGLVGLAIGRHDVVRLAGDFIIELVALQSELDQGFFLIRDAHGDIVTSYPADEERVHVVKSSRTQVHPLYYALGLGLTFLAALYEKTGDDEYLTGAKFFADQCRIRGEEVFQHHYTGKICWGMSLLYSLTGAVEYREMAEQSADYLLRTQMQTGAWRLPTLYGELTSQPLEVTLDRTAEYALWLSLYCQCMRSI